MGWPVSADALLSGPRGRRLCWSLLDSLLDARAHPAWGRFRYDVWRGACQDDLTGLVSELSAWVTVSGPSSIAESADELRLLAALVKPVEDAMYWQPPDDLDGALANEAVQRALLPVAHAVTVAAATRWWPSPVSLESQRYVEWTDQHGSPLMVSAATAELASWRAGVERDSGAWWSAPLSRIPVTTRAIAGLGAVGLGLVEDGLGCDQARCWPVETTRSARIYEITGPQRWADLVGRYPLDVTRSRRDHWQLVTGYDSSWLIPDFEAIASDYDGIHLSVIGYLLTAGRALAVGDARTLLAGWDPDQTYWLTEILAVSGPSRTWKLGGHPAQWKPDDT